MITTTKAKASQYTQGEYEKAIQARKLQTIIMHPGTREMSDVAIKHLGDCPITRDDLRAADDIFVQALGGLKGKTVRRPNPHVSTYTNGVPPHIMSRHKSVTIGIDIMFVNKIPFLFTISRDMKFGTVEALNNQQITTVADKLKTVINLYSHRGFSVDAITADQEFEQLRPWYPMLNCAGADEHVPEVERYIRTVKDRVQSTYQILPYKYIPRIMLIHLIKNAVLWLIALPTRDGISNEHSP